MLQLVNGRVKVFLTKQGIRELDEYNADNFQVKTGITPAQVADYKGLVGDASDNLPGIKGIGPKTALQLLERYQTCLLYTSPRYYFLVFLTMIIIPHRPFYTNKKRENLSLLVIITPAARVTGITARIPVVRIRIRIGVRVRIRDIGGISAGAP